MEKIPNLIDNDNNRLKDVETQKREELLSTIKEKRAQRDDLLKESSSLKTKIKDIFGSHKKENLEYKIKNIQDRLYRDVNYKKENIYKELSNESREIIIETIEKPLIDLKNIFYKLSDSTNTPEENNLLKKDAKNIIENFKFQNIIEGFNNPILSEKITYYLDNFLENDNYSYDKYRSENEINFSSFSRKLSEVFLSKVSNEIENGNLYEHNIDINFLRAVRRAQNINAFNHDKRIENNLSILMNDAISKIDIFYLSQVPELIDLAANRSVEFRKNLDNKIKSIFIEEKWCDINSACKSRSKYLSEIAIDSLDNYLKILYGISAGDIKFAWELFPPIESGGYKFNNIDINITKMKELESIRPGIVKSLFSEFGIKEFHRYPTDVLIKQFDTKDQDLPYGVVLFTNDDHNDAFDLDREIIESIFKQTDNKLLIRISEFQSRFSFLKNLASFNKRYGKKNKIEYLLWGAHGWQGAIGNIGNLQLNGEGAKRTKEFFIDKPEIILASCSTGAEGAIAQTMSEIYNATVHAPSIPSNLEKVLVNFDSQNKLHFKVDFKDNCGNTYSLGNKINQHE